MNILITRGHTEAGFHGWRVYEIVGGPHVAGQALPKVTEWPLLHPTAQSALDRVIESQTCLRCNGRGHIRERHIILGSGHRWRPRMTLTVEPMKDFDE